MSNLHWEHTGVCPQCGKRTITCGHCKACGSMPRPSVQPQACEVERTGYHTRSRLGTPDAVMSR